MSLPLSVRTIVAEVTELLDPHFNLQQMVNIHDNTIGVEGKSFAVLGQVHLFAAGKAASYELKAFKEIIESSELAPKLGLCVALTKQGHTVPAQKDMVQLEGTHPLVSEQNLQVTQEFIDYLRQVKKSDTFIFLLSGGASALMELPKPGISFADLQRTHGELLTSGLNINEMNRVRKSLSQVKDGGLLDFIDTKHILQFITCDIPNEHLADVSSGPLMGPDQSTHPATFKSQHASKLLRTLCRDRPERQEGKVYDCLLASMEDDLYHHLPSPGQFHLSGGEATLQVPAHGGRGGRNTHFVLSFAHRLYREQDKRDLHIVSFGTDGSDGPTDAAGAYLNYELYQQLAAGEYLNDFNSYDYFDKLNTLIKTGPTRTNVMDIRFLWRE